MAVTNTAASKITCLKC